MNLDGDSHFNQARIEWAIRLRYSPMPKLDPELMASQLNAFRIGELRIVGKTWETMMERSGELAVNADKRYSDLAGLQWSVVSDGSPDGDKHAAALSYFYKHLTATKALDQDSIGGVTDLLYQMASAHSYYYSAHEILLRVDNAAAKEVTAEFRHTPIWFFEARRGYLAYLKHIFDMYGQPPLAGEWLTCVGLGWMRPLSMAFCTEMFTFRDWQVWCLRYASGFLEGIVDDAPGNTGWEEARQALQTMANDGAVLHSPKVVMKFLEQAARTGMPFSELVQLVHGLYAKCYRGVDLATSSKSGGASSTGSGGSKNPVGASVQKEESGIFLARDASWSTGYLNQRVDRPVISYLFGQEPRAGIAVLPPLDDLSDSDLNFLKTAVPLGLRIAMKDVYKRFKWDPPAEGDVCLTPPAPTPGAGDSPASEGAPAFVPANAPSAVPAPQSAMPTKADESDEQTQSSQLTEQTAIAAGARPQAIAQIAAPEMPDPQVKAGSMMSQAVQTVKNALRFWRGSNPSTDSSGNNPGPAFGYAIPNTSEVSTELEDNGRQLVAEQVHAELQHAAGKVIAILQIQDPDLRERKLKQLAAQWDGITLDTLQAPTGLADAIANITGTGLAAGLSERPGAALANDNPNHDEKGLFSSAEDKVKAVMSGKLDESAYAKVSPETAGKIKDATGRDVSGYQHFIDHDALVHINREHGVGHEDQPDHEPVTADDIARIPSIVANPDSVSDGGQSSRGRPSVKYAKQSNGTTYYVEEQWKDEKLMAAKTMYKIQAPGNSATPGGGVSHTSKTFGAKGT